MTRTELLIPNSTSSVQFFEPWVLDQTFCHFIYNWQVGKLIIAGHLILAYSSFSIHFLFSFFLKKNYSQLVMLHKLFLCCLIHCEYSCIYKQHFDFKYDCYMLARCYWHIVEVILLLFVIIYNYLVYLVFC